MAIRKVTLPSGRVIWCKGGTEKVDGHWAFLRRACSRRGFNTTKRTVLWHVLRANQWRYWEGPSTDKFRALGPALRRQRQVEEDERSVRDLQRDAEARGEKRAHASYWAVKRRTKGRPAAAGPPLALRDISDDDRPLAPAQRVQCDMSDDDQPLQAARRARSVAAARLASAPSVAGHCPVPVPRGPQCRGENAAPGAPTRRRLRRLSVPASAVAAAAPGRCLLPAAEASASTARPASAQASTAADAPPAAPARRRRGQSVYAALRAASIEEESDAPAPPLGHPRLDPVRKMQSRFKGIADAKRAAEEEAERHRQAQLAALLGPAPPLSPPRAPRPQMPPGISVLEGRGGPALR